MMTQHVMKTTAALFLFGLLSTGALAQGAVDADQPPAPGLPEAQQGDQSEPNWPVGLESWNSEERDPENVEPQAAEKKGLTDENVKESLAPPPTEQGTRAPRPLLGPEEREQMGLYEMLKLVRSAPAGLDGQTIPRPNTLGSEPTTEMEPIGGPDYLFPEGYVE